jgi:rod shape-determining protein MreD
MRRTLVLFATAFVLWAIVAQANHALSEARVHLFAGGLFVAYAALTQPGRPALAAAVLGGLLCDAGTPVAFGTHGLLFAAAHLMIVRARDRVPRDDTIAAVIVALFANLALFLVFSATRFSDASVLWPRLLVDLACSQVFLAVAAPWFFAFQAQALALARVPRVENA